MEQVQVIKNVLHYVKTTRDYVGFEYDEDTVDMMIRDFEELVSNLKHLKRGM